MRRMLLLVLMMSGIMYATADSRLSLPVIEVKLQVLDDAGSPVSALEVKVSGGLELDGLADSRTKGVTDGDGRVTLKVRTAGYLMILAEKTGYYPTWIQNLVLETGADRSRARSGTHEVGVTLRKIVNPIAMVGRNCQHIALPTLNKPVGFDLIQSDWVAPYGSGKYSDLVFTVFNRHYNNLDDRETEFKISFANPDDGVQKAQRFNGSKLRLSREAPKEGYNPELTKVLSASSSKGVESAFDENANYFIRVRTVKDLNGKIQSALYGKIHGDFALSPYPDHAKVQFTYYLNPTPNDRNLECDPKRNLLQGLKPSEQIKEP